MKNMTWRAVFVLSLALNVGTIGAFAYHRFWQGRPGESATGSPSAVGTSLREELRLSDDQVSRFNELHVVLQNRILDLRGRMRAARQEFFTLLAHPSPDSTAIGRALDDISRTQFAVQRVVADYLLAQALVLTPDQRAVFALSMSRRAGEPDSRHLPLVGDQGAPQPDERR